MSWLLQAFSLHHRDERGTSAVEFALVAPAFLLLIFGVLDFGFGIWTYNNVAEAAREGARYAIVRGDGATIGEVAPPALGTPETGTCDNTAGKPVVNVVCGFALSLDPSKLTVTVDWTCNADTDLCANDPDSGNHTGQLMKVTATYQYSSFVLQTLIGSFVGASDLSMNLRSTTRMHIACCS